MKLELKYHSFKENQKNIRKNNFRPFFLTQKSKKSVFQDLWSLLKLVEKISKFHKSVQKSRECCVIDPKLIFWTLGGLCGQNESYTSLVRQFLMIFYNREIRPFLADILEITFFVTLQNQDIAEGKHNLLGKLFFRANFFLEMLIWFLRRWNFGFWVICMVKINFSTFWSQRPRIF